VTNGEMDTLVFMGHYKCLVYPKGSGISSIVIENVNSDYTSNSNKRRSLIDKVFTLSRCAISWNETLELTAVALSTTEEAEYLTLVEVVKEVETPLNTSKKKKKNHHAAAKFEKSLSQTKFKI
jgi:hypothetical protein